MALSMLEVSGGGIQIQRLLIGLIGHILDTGALLLQRQAFTDISNSVWSAAAMRWWR